MCYYVIFYNHALYTLLFIDRLKPKIYLQDVFVYFNLSAIIFLLLTAILRATGSRSQWAFAALAYIAYSTLALEYLSLMK